MLYKCSSLFLMVFINYFYHKESRRIKGVKNVSTAAFHAKLHQRPTLSYSSVLRDEKRNSIHCDNRSHILGRWAKKKCSDSFSTGDIKSEKKKKIIILRLEMERWRDTKREWQAEIDELKPSFLKCTSYTSSCLIQSLAPSLKYRNVCFQKTPHIYKFCWQPKCPSSHCEAIISLLHRNILQI